VPSKDELLNVPEDVIDEIGHKLSLIQHGEDADEPGIKRFHEDSRIAHLHKVLSDGSDGNTYRGVATVEFEEGVWVIDVFKKQSTSGISTPKKDIDRIAGRLARLKEFRKTPDGLSMIAGMAAEYEAEHKRLGIELAKPGVRRR